MVAEAVQNDVCCSPASDVDQVGVLMAFRSKNGVGYEECDRRSTSALEDINMGQSQQSPINLQNPLFNEFGKDGLQIKWQKSASGHIKKDEHGVHVVFDADERQYVILNRRKFHLVQFHFHHPSEHWVNGKQQTMELHVVHQNIDDASRAVVGIFIEPTDETAKALDLFALIKAFASGATTTPEKPATINPLAFLPKDTEHYYRYEGSLTTPDYDENVSWAILKEPLKRPKKEVAEMIRIFQHPARFPQPLNRRYLLANFRS